MTTSHHSPCCLTKEDEIGCSNQCICQGDVKKVVDRMERKLFNLEDEINKSREINRDNFLKELDILSRFEDERLTKF